MFRIFRRNADPLSDEELVIAYKTTGDPAHLGVLYERYVELTYGVCLKYLKDPAKAQDAVMSIFETLFGKVKTQDIRQFRPWLHVVAKNHCLMQLRKKNILVAYDDLSPAAEAELMQSAGFVHPVENFDDYNSDEKALRQCIQQLPHQQRHCIEQFYFEEKSYKEIAGLTGEEIGLVRSFIQNGRRNLRLCMEKTLKMTKVL
jgi:RNA polymerase sigma-70 factor (ECF subfamily)